MKLEKLREIASKRTRDGFIPIDNMIMLETHIHGLLDVVEAGIKLRNYIEECYPGLYVTDTINEALAKLEEIE